MKQMKRMVLLLLTVVFAVSLPLSAFAAGTIEVTEDVSVSDDYDWTRFKGQNVTLNVYNWGEYISNGSDDSVDVVDAFQKLTGIHVNYTTFDSNESLYAKLKSGAADYDVIIPSDYMVAKMISEGMLAKLNFDNIPNFQNIDEVYRNADYDPANEYTVPYMLCTTGIIYNTSMVDKAPASWADLWDAPYAANILMFNNSRDAYAIAAFATGHSINPQSTEEVDEVVGHLKAQKPLVQAYVMDEIFDKMIGDVHQLHVRSGHRQGQRRIYRLHHPHAGRVGGAGRGPEVQRDRLPFGGDRSEGKGLHCPERRGQQ